MPTEAQKQITGGRLNGMTDIRPQWRIEKLTELFGPAGIGWKAPITNKEIIEGANGEKVAIVDCELYIKVNGEWSDAIQGTGGSSFIAKESKGLFTSDECYKMAYTDAISVACKALGIGADIYWGDSKYKDTKSKSQSTPIYSNKKASEAQIKMLRTVAGDGVTFKKAAEKYGYKSSAEILAKDVNTIKAEIEKNRGGQD